MICPGCEGTGTDPQKSSQGCVLCGGNGLVNLDRLRTGMALAEAIQCNGLLSPRTLEAMALYDTVLKEHAARREHRRRERERQERKQPPKVNPSCGSVEPHDHSRCSAHDSMMP